MPLLRVTMSSQEEKPEIRIVRGLLKEKHRVVITDSGDADYLREKDYGIPSEEGLVLEPVEALYLLDKGYLDLRDENGKKVEFKDLLALAAREDKDIWLRFELYTDLRQRGLRVKPGFLNTVSFMVDKKSKNSPKRYLVCGLREGVRLGFKELETLYTAALESGRELVIAVQDKEGNISYYTVSKFS